MYQTGFKNLSRLAKNKIISHQQYFLKNLSYLYKQMMSVSDRLYLKSVSNHASQKSDICQIKDETPKSTNTVLNTQHRRYMNLSKEKVIDTILEQETKNYESIRSDLTKSANDEKNIEEANAKKINRRINKFSITNK